MNYRGYKIVTEVGLIKSTEDSKRRYDPKNRIKLIPSFVTLRYKSISDLLM